MSRKCRTCGNPDYDDASVFCNKCGTRLPILTFPVCLTCGAVYRDQKSQYCSKCGAPLSMHAPPIIPSASVIGKRCPGCGFMNVDETQFYCKQCGIFIGKHESESHTENRHDTATRIKPDPIDVVRQKNPPVRETVKQIHPYQNPQRNRSRSFRKTAIVGAGTILIIIIIGMIFVLGPNFLPSGLINSAIAESAGSPGSAPISAIDSSTGAEESKIPPTGSREQPDNIPAAGSSDTYDSVPPWLTKTSDSPAPAEISNALAPDSAANDDSVPPWLTEKSETTSLMPPGSSGTTPPWPTTGNIDSAPPWLTGTK